MATPQEELLTKSVRKDEMQARTANGGGVFRFYFAPGILSSPLLSLPIDPPPYWTPSRDRVLLQAYRRCGLWASAVNIAVTHISSMGYEVSGDIALRVRQAREMLGRDWAGLMMRLTRDYVTFDNGGFMQIVRATSGYGSKVLGYMYLPGARCVRTGDPDYPVVYMDEIGRLHELRSHEVVAFSDMPEDDLFGVGLCATSRAYDAIYEHLSVRQFFKEKATGRRPLALDFLTGISQEAVDDTIAGAKIDAAAMGMQAYMGTALTANANNVPLNHVRIPLADLPAGFDQGKHTELVEIEFAAALGIDPTDLNPQLIGNRQLGAGAQAQVLDDKTTSKGLVSLRQQLLAFFNDTEQWHPLPNSVTFAFSEKDLKDQQAQAAIASTRAATRAAQIASGEISAQEARQLAVDEGDLPTSFIAVDQTPDESLTDEDKASGDLLPDPTGPVVPLLPAPIVPATKEFDALAIESLKAYATNLATLTMPTTRKTTNTAHWQAVTKAFGELGSIWTVAARQNAPQDSGELGRSIRYAVTNKDTAAVTLKLYAGNKARPEVAIRAVLFGRKGFAAKKEGGMLRFQIGGKTIYTRSVRGAVANDWLGRSLDQIGPQLKAFSKQFINPTVDTIEVEDIAGATIHTSAEPAPKR